jgi:hypothetical protein
MGFTMMAEGIGGINVSLIATSGTLFLKARLDADKPNAAVSLEGAAGEYLYISAAETPSALAERSQIAELVREEIDRRALGMHAKSGRNATSSSPETAHKEVGRHPLSQ